MTIKKIILIFLIIVPFNGIFGQNPEKYLHLAATAKTKEEAHQYLFLFIKAGLDKPTTDVPVVAPDYSMPWNMHLQEKMQILAQEMFANMKLEYIDYVANDSLNIPDDSAIDHFEIKAFANVKIPKGTNLNDYFKIEISPKKENTIADISKLKAEKNFGDLTKEDSIIFGKKFFFDSIAHHNTFENSPVSPYINPHGKLNIEFKYLVGYDTLSIDKHMKNKALKLNNFSFELKFVRKGDLYLKFQDSIPPESVVKELRYIALNSDKQVIHEIEKTWIVNENREGYKIDHTGPWNFKRELFGHSIFLKDKVLNSSDEEALKYIQNIDTSKIEKENNLLILQTDLDFEKIYLLWPKYQTMKKELKSTIKRDTIKNFRWIDYTSKIPEEKEQN